MENQQYRQGGGFNMMSSAFREPDQPQPTRGTETGEKPKLMVLVLDKLITICIFMLFFGVPLFFTGLSFQGLAFEKEMYFYFWILVGLVVWATKGVVLGELKIRRTPLDIPIALFFIIYAFASYFSVDRWHSFMGFPGDPSRGLLSITALIIAYYFVFSHFNSQRLKWIMAAILSAGAIISVWTLLGIRGINFLPAKLLALAPLSLIGSVSGVGVFLGALIPLVITAIFKLKGQGEGGILQLVLKVGLLLLLALDLFLLFALYAFVSWVAVLLGIGFFLIFILSLVVRPAENWTWLPMVTFVLIMIIMMVGNTFKVVKVNLPVEVSPSYQMSWEVAKNSLKDKLLLGSGAATYGYDFSLYKPKEFNLNALYNLRFYQGTGIFFEALPSIGLLGTIALVLLLLTFLSVSVYLLVHRKERDKVYSLGFVTAALILVIAGVSTRIESTLLIMSALVATAALALVMQESDSEERFLNLSLKASPKFALTLAFVFMVVSAGVAYLFVFIGKIYAADLYAGTSIRQNQVKEDGSITDMIKAIGLNSREARYYTQASQQYMALANIEAAKDEASRDVNAVKNYLNNSIAFAAQGRGLMPNDVLATESLAQIYENAGIYVSDSISLAEKTYQEALNLEPHSPNLIVKLGQMKLAEAVNTQDKDQKKQLIGEAKDLFQKSIDEKPNFSVGYYQLALTQKALGNLDDAIGSMAKALSLENNNANIVFSLASLYQERNKGDDAKIAEALYKQILNASPDEINTHFSLGMLYEKNNRKDDAIAEYRKVMSLLPAGSDQAKTQLQKMIGNVQSGIPNTAENLAASAPANPAPVASPAPAPAAGTAPVSAPAVNPATGQ